MIMIDKNTTIHDYIMSERLFVVQAHNYFTFLKSSCLLI